MPGPVQFTADMLGMAGMSGTTDHAPVEQQLVQMPAPDRAVKSPTKSKFATQNVLKLAKARLKDVKAELRRLSVLEKERAELERLIQAAENKPPRLVAIKRTAG